MLTIPSVKGFVSFLSEMWSLFLRIGSGLGGDGHRVYQFTREVWKARVWLASTHFILNIGFEILRVTDYLSQTLKIEI